MKQILVRKRGSFIEALLNGIFSDMRRKVKNTFTAFAVMNKMKNGQMSAHRWSRQEPHAPFLPQRCEEWK